MKRMVADWINSLDKRPSERSGEDLDLIYSQLRHIRALEKYHPVLLQQICYYGFYEDLEQGITLFRQGDIGTNWYIVLSGLLEVTITETGEDRDAVSLCILGPGTSFGESILTNQPRHATVITRDFTELIRVEQKNFHTMWSNNKQLMEGLMTPLENLGLDVLNLSDGNVSKMGVREVAEGEDHLNPAAPITKTPSAKLAHAGHILRTVLLTVAPHMIRDRKYHLRTYRRCLVGSEMVDWLTQQSTLVLSRNQAVGMWQALLEENVIVHVCHNHQFKDKYLFYRFLEDDQGMGSTPSPLVRRQAEEELADTITLLAQIGPDAMMRMILRKLPEERTPEDLETIYEELLHIKALSHLSTMVKRELASVLVFESHQKAGTVLFNQGDEGKSWYIILKGSVNVVIYGKGVVCTLHDGDDFGKLALVNDAPRAATIVLREDNCHFLRVDKDDFNRILRDVEANTVRLKEHGQDVLVLEKIPITSHDKGKDSHYKYSVMAGTPEKMLEYLLETRLDTKAEGVTGVTSISDGLVQKLLSLGSVKENTYTFLEDFLLTHMIFMTGERICSALLNYYHTEASQTKEQDSVDFLLTHKHSVVHFVQEWSLICPTLFEDPAILTFLEELHRAVKKDSDPYPSLREEAERVQAILHLKDSPPSSTKTTKKHITPSLTLSRKASRDQLLGTVRKKQPIKASDENIFKVYCADHTYSTLRVPMDTSVADIVSHAPEKLGLGSDLVLCEVKSTGERVPFSEDDICVTTGLSLNGRLFITPREHLDALTPLPEQEGPTAGSLVTLELMSTRELAGHLTQLDWELFTVIPEEELIYHVIGRHLFKRITANLDLFLRQFNLVQYWVVTEVVLCPHLSKRVHLLRKLIKLAAYCKEFQNLHSFFAIVMGLSNIAVSRLSQTWEKLPSKFKQMFAEFETVMDPSRNHRVYRLTMAKLHAPVIPFMPLLLKDMTFTHEGNKTYFDNLVNFEKMHLFAQTLRTIKFCKRQPMELELPPTLKSSPDINSYIRNIQVIDNQRTLTRLSHKLEPRRA